MSIDGWGANFLAYSDSPKILPPVGHRTFCYNSYMSYTHIFTDGVDKLLSASSWFMWYGGKDAFCFYENNALKGYIEDNEYERLASVGEELLKDEDFIHELFTSAEQLSEELKRTHKRLESDSFRNIKTLRHASTLLKKSYKNYFFTEEYYTNNLDPEADAELIEKIGKFRYESIKDCIQATEDVHIIAKQLVGDDAEFYMVDEVLRNEEIQDLDQRKSAFVLIQKDHKLELISGQEAKAKYTSLYKQKVPANITTITGMGASKGKASGPVYKISLTSNNLSKQIMDMPEGAILVTESTQPHMILACKKASAIVSDEGGVLSHAAIVARELGIPCVVGTRIGTQILQNFDTISIDGESGKVIILES